MYTMEVIYSLDVAFEVDDWSLADIPIPIS